MPRNKQKTKAEDLTRVRNNQRRCRQRKRDYVAELERRLVSIEDTTSHEITRLQSITDDLRQENERLTALLDLWGVNYNFPRPSRQIENENNVLENICSDPVPSEDRPSLGDTGPGEISQLRFYSSESYSAEKFKDSPMDTSYLPIAPDVEPVPGSSFLPEKHVPRTNLRTEVSKDKYEDTTVCAVALELVMNCNAKNLSILELDMRLRCGYRSARFQWEGCRVDNQVLFAVLAEIM
ncbi:hypothetical protein BDV59DRAFT_178239 [Aspergillus ambiguus]|uniref:uncharacterized protein n=1 Tax=Aspergillus ambiguus TaxID=176160 RepID=UPI003CCCBC39